MIEAIKVFVFALATVFVGMGLLTGLLFGLRALAARTAARAAGTPAAAVGEELVAVLAAAAYVAIGKPVRVHRVHVHRERAAEAWSRAGRMDIMVSHRVELKR